MATEEWQTRCPEHGLVLGRREMPNHLLHFFITILTCSLWGFAWAFLAITARSQPYTCPICGSEGANS